MCLFCAYLIDSVAESSVLAWNVVKFSLFTGMMSMLTFCSDCCREYSAVLA